MPGTILIMRGLPGSGKSTHAETLAQKHGAVIVSADFFFLEYEKWINPMPTPRQPVYRFDPKLLPQAHASCLRDFVRAIHGNKGLIIVDNTNLSVADLAPYAALALAYRYDLQILQMATDSEVCFARQVHGVSRHVFSRMVKTLQSEVIPRRWPVTLVPCQKL